MAPRKPKNNQPTPPSIQGVDWNGSLADYKQSTVGNVKPGGTKVVTENRGPDTGMFAGSGTPLNSSIGMQDTSRKNVTNVIKNLAIQEIGGAAIAKGVSKAIPAIVKSGIPGRVSNIIKGETVLVHGSPVRGLNEIKPSLSRAMPNEARVFGMRTDVPLNVQGATQSVTTGYAEGSSWVGTSRGQIPQGGGSLYVIKTPKATTDLPIYPKKPVTPQFTESGRPVIQFPPSVATSSKSAAKVSGEIPLQGKTAAEVQAALRAELKKAGAKVQPNIVEKMMSKAEAKKLAARAKNNPSVV